MAQSETAFFEQLLALTAAGDLASVARVARERTGWLLERAPAARDGEPYGRLPLHDSARGELMLAGWQAHARCAPHDHGDARGVVIILAGHFIETRYAQLEVGLAPSGRSEAAEGETVMVGRGLIHDMRCERAGASLHLYLPAIAEMRVYDLARRRTFIVDERAGAWLPCDARHVRAVEAWPSAPT